MKGTTMNWNHWIRQTHRWLAIAFTLAVILNFVALWRDYRAVWVGVLALIPLFLLMFSGLYMFALPYVAKQRGGRQE